MKLNTETIRQRNEAIIKMLENGESDKFIANSLGTQLSNVAGFRKTLGIIYHVGTRDYTRYGRLSNLHNKPYQLVLPVRLLPTMKEWKLDTIDEKNKTITLSYR